MKKTPPVPVARSADPVDRELVSLGGRVLLPDLRGLTVSDVRAIARSGGLHVVIEGEGRAVSQDPPPGTIVATREARIRVRFEPATEELARSQLPLAGAPDASTRGGDSI
jgi:hypothetical protein